MAAFGSFRSFRTRGVLALLAVALFSACGHYRMVRMDDIQIPDYEPRPVAVPLTCDSLITRAADLGMVGFDESEARELNFCQQQQLIRAQEEEAASRKLEAHATAAHFALQLTVVAVGALIGLLAWIF